jgi:N-acetylneuraminate synthase/N,N'-diacetyllegionaminate synthase
MDPIEIGGRLIGEGQPVFIVAEAGINHNGSEEIALKMVEAAAQSGADAIKFQSFRTEHLIAPDAGAPSQVQEGSRLTLFEFFKSLELSAETHRKLKRRADSLGLVFLSTAFDTEMADLLEELDVPAFKIASGDITHRPLLEHVAAKGRPVILSTGASSFDEVRNAAECLRENGAGALALLHCVSAYPANPEELNLRAIQTMKEALSLPVGFSDHTVDRMFSLAAVAAGACILERHFTLDRGMSGPDQVLSMEPDELRRTVGQIRLLQSALGDGAKRPTPGEVESRVLGRRSVVAGMDIPEGRVLEPAMLDILRPGDGIPPMEITKLLGRRLLRKVPQGQALRWSDLE